jgi:hypothetical protein
MAAGLGKAALARSMLPEGPLRAVLASKIHPYVHHIESDAVDITFCA